MVSADALDPGMFPGGANPKDVVLAVFMHLRQAEEEAALDFAEETKKAEAIWK